MDCVRDWWNGDDAKPIEFATVGWEGTNAAPREPNATIRLYVTAWENPFPDKKVQTIDYITNNTLAAPFRVAMTLDQPVQPPTSCYNVTCEKCLPAGQAA